MTCKSWGMKEDEKRLKKEWNTEENGTSIQNAESVTLPPRGAHTHSCAFCGVVVVVFTPANPESHFPIFPSHNRTLIMISYNLWARRGRHAEQCMLGERRVWNVSQLKPSLHRSQSLQCLLNIEQEHTDTAAWCLVLNTLTRHEKHFFHISLSSSFRAKLKNESK